MTVPVVAAPSFIRLDINFFKRWRPLGDHGPFMTIQCLQFKNTGKVYHLIYNTFDTHSYMLICFVDSSIFVFLHVLVFLLAHGTLFQVY